MNKKFLVAMMAMVLGGTLLAGCATSKENTSVNQETVVTEENATQVEAEDKENEDEKSIENTGNTENTGSAENTTEDEIGETTEVDVEGAVEDIEVEEVYGEVDPSVAQEMLFVITDGIELPKRMNMDATMFQDTYGIATNHLSSYVVSMPTMNVHATEIAVFEVVDENARAAVKAGIEKRVKALTEQWQSYLPDQYELVKNYKVVDKGNLVLFVISGEADAIISKFEVA